MSGHNDLFRLVPRSHFFFGHRMYTHTMHPSDIIVGSLDTHPAIALQYAHWHPHQTLRHHFRRKIRSDTHICHRHIDNTAGFAFQPLHIGKQFKTVHYGIAFSCQFLQQYVFRFCRSSDATQHHILIGKRIIYIQQCHTPVRCKLFFQTVGKVCHLCRYITISGLRSNGK